MVNVDIVYKTVLYILNKEQRGYLTPDEFNKLGIQVQREIFEKYFDDLNQQLRVPQSDNEYSDRIRNLEEKIDIFKTSADCTHVPANSNFSFPTDLYRLGTLMYEPTGLDFKEIQPMNYNEYFLVNKSPLTKPTTTYPVYVLQGTGAPSAAPSDVFVYPNTITSKVKAYYTRIPSDPRWGYSVGSLGQYIYDSTTYGANLLNNGGILSNFTTPLAGGVVGTYTPTFTTSGAGVGLVLSASVASATGVAITITNPGSGFAVGDTITINNNQLGGGSTGPVITLTAADFNSGSTYGSTQFELHQAEQTNLILNILMYTGVIIRDPNVVQAATTLVQQDEVNQKS